MTTRQNETNLGPRLVCFADTGICDGKGEHDIRIWTDGHVAYAIVGETEEECLVSRDLNQIEVTCGATREGLNGSGLVHCGGHARFDLTDEAWTADARAVGMLNSYGEALDV